MNELSNPIVRISSHAGKDYAIAILTYAFPCPRSNDLRVRVLDVEKGSVFDAPLDWVRLHSRPAYTSGSRDQHESESRVSAAIESGGYGSPEFDRGAAEPMHSWSERNAQLK